MASNRPSLRQAARPHPELRYDARMTQNQNLATC